MLTDLWRSWARLQLTDPAYGFLLEEDASGELVCLACTATSFAPGKAELRRLVAIVIRGNRLLTGERLDMAVGPDGLPVEEAVVKFMHFAGARPLVGYFLEFTVGLIDKTVRPMIGINVPNQRIEVSSLYYQRRGRIGLRFKTDLRFDTILRDLELPERGEAPTPLDDAICAGLIYLKLQGPDRQ